jgi:hypothetical protein
MAYDNDPAGNGYTTHFGKVDFWHTKNGFVVSCQCKKFEGDECWLEFDTSFDSWLTKNATNFHFNAKANGKFDLVTSTLVTCRNGANYVNGTEVSSYACYGWQNTK